MSLKTQAQQNQEIQLWPDGAPGALGDKDEDKPTITAYFPSKEKSSGTAVVICPGGAYINLAKDHEGKQVAEWFNTLGVTAFVLKYRLGTWDFKKYRHPAPMMDAAQAMKIVRHRAKEWNINPAKVGIMGFSAGGHLASTIGTHFKEGDPKAKAKVDQVSSRPDFMILIYPVISFTAPYAHTFSRDVLLGPNSSAALADSLSNEKHITPGTPPTFLVHSDNDDGVLPENSIAFYTGLRAAKVPAEMHIYERGGHGFGMTSKDPVVASWIDRLKDWMKGRGLL